MMIILPKQKDFKAVRRILFRVVLLLLPLLILPLLELFVLPVDFFTFRVWEAALATPYRYPGAFYPNLHVKKAKEYSDRYRLGNPEWKQSKSVEWFTDSYGFRNRPEIEKRDKYDVVVLGDSNIVGSFLDQKDTLSETLIARSGQTAYSYSYGSDHIGLYFSDPRMMRKRGKLLVVESKVGNWLTNGDYLRNFYVLPDGSLEVTDRSKEFADNFYAPKRNQFWEKLRSRWAKKPMFNWLKSEFSVEFSVPARVSNETFVGVNPTGDWGALAENAGWRPAKWVISNGVIKPLSTEPQLAIAIRSTGPNCYWHTEQFFSARPDGKIMVHFQAKNLTVPCRYQMYIFEDGVYRGVGKFIAGNHWQAFEIPIATSPGAVLEFQIDQPDNWQWLSIRNFHVVDGAVMPLVKSVPVQEKVQKRNVKKLVVSSNSISKPQNLTSLAGSVKLLTASEIQYYFYQAAKAIEKKAQERGMDFILFVMPDYNISCLMPAIKQLRSEGVKVLAYESQVNWVSGVEENWYWHKTDSHWTEAAVRLTADEILNMWKERNAANRPFSKELMDEYTKGF